MKRFSLITELLKMFTVTDIKQLFRYSTLLSVPKRTFLANHRKHTSILDTFKNRLYFITRGQGIATQEWSDSLTDQPERQFANLPDWKIVQDPSYVITEITELINNYIVRQGTKTIQDLTSLLLSAIRKPKATSMWSKAKNGVMQKDVASIELTVGDFFSSNLDQDNIQQIHVIGTLLAKEDMDVIEVNSQGLNSFISHIQRKAKLNELNSLGQISLFQMLKQYQVQLIYKQVKIQKFNRGHVIYNEGDTSDTLYIVREGEVELVRRNMIENHEPQDEFRISRTKFLYQQRKVVDVMQTFGEKDCLLRRPRTYMARVCTADAVLYVIKFSEYLRILDQADIKKQTKHVQLIDQQQQYELPQLYNQILSPPEQGQIVRYRKHVDIKSGITYLREQKEGMNLVDQFHEDQSQLQIYQQQCIYFRKSVQIYLKQRQLYKSIDTKHPLIEPEVEKNEKLLRFKNIQREYTRKIRTTQQSQRSSPETHQDKMKQIQQSSPQTFKVLKETFMARKTFDYPKQLKVQNYSNIM